MISGGLTEGCGSLRKTPNYNFFKSFSDYLYYLSYCEEKILLYALNVRVPIIRCDSELK